MDAVTQRINELQAQVERLTANQPRPIVVTEPNISPEFVAECAGFNSPANTLRRLATRDPPPAESPLAPVAIPPQLGAVADARHVAYRSDHDAVNGLHQAAWTVMRTLAAFREARAGGDEGYSHFVERSLAELFGALTYEADQQTKTLVNKLCKELKLPIHVSSIALDAVVSGNTATFDARLADHIRDQTADRRFRASLQAISNQQQPQYQH
ncbi:hypothetical protein FBU31_000051, partial [Coemansia sp. 'formosensis']